jgi:NAD-dependent deacetylase
MCRPAVGDDDAVALDGVLVAEARALQVAAARVHDQPVVEHGRLDVARVRLQDERLEAFVAQPLVAVRELLEVLDARHLEPDEVARVVGDPLGVRLGEANADLGCETEPVHEAQMLAELIRANQPCVVLTGAGVSTESGIPDFRSPNGIWAQYDPMEYATISAFRRDPEKVWDFYGRRLGVLEEARPNAAHAALAELEAAGWVRAVITQNIDRLHERAGSRDVIEVHGSIRTSSCLECGERVPFDDVVARLPVPRCSCGEVLKPDVVMFGELLPVDAIDRASELARRAALLLVVGSSLEVYPVAALPDDTLRAGGKLAIVNRDATPYDGDAQLVVHASAGETLAAVVATL